MQNYFKLPNSIFEFESKLKNSEFVIFAYLVSVEQANKNSKGKVYIKERTIATATGLSISNVILSLKRLQARGMIIITHTVKHFTWLQGANIYSVPQYRNLSGGYFVLPRSVFALKLRPTEFILMAFLKRSCNHCERSWASLSQIMQATGLSKSSITKANNKLSEGGLIQKEQYIKQDTSYGHNHYLISFVRTIKRIVGKILKSIPKKKGIITTVIGLVRNVCKRVRNFFVARGSPKTIDQLYYPLE